MSSNIIFEIVTDHIASMGDDTDSTEGAVAQEPRDLLVETFRKISENPIYKQEEVVIPEGCEQYGFSEGVYKLSEVLCFLADMLE